MNIYSKNQIKLNVTEFTNNVEYRYYLEDILLTCQEPMPKENPSITTLLCTYSGSLDVKDSIFKIKTKQL